MSILLIIAIIAAFASLVLNAYNYFGDRSLRHLYRATDYTSQSALNKATENRKLIDDLGGDFGAKVAELEKKYLDRIQGNDTRILELDSRTTAMKTHFDNKLADLTAQTIRNRSLHQSTNGDGITRAER